KLEDIFAGKSLVVMFNGDKERILADTARELSGVSLGGKKDAGHVDPGAPLGEDQFQMMVGVRDDYRLDPRQEVSMPLADMFAFEGNSPAHEFENDLIYVPRIPLDTTEAEAMLHMITVFTDTTDLSVGVRTYAGYTDDELRRGRPAVMIR